MRFQYELKGQLANLQSSIYRLKLDTAVWIT